MLVPNNSSSILSHLQIILLNEFRANKSNLRIAPNTNPSQQYSPLVTIDLSGLSTSPTNNNNNNNNNDRNNTINPSHNHQNIITTPILSSPPNNFAKFASSHSSPSLEDTSNTISVATQNVRGINNTTKFDSIMDDLFRKISPFLVLQKLCLPHNQAKSCS